MRRTLLGCLLATTFSVAQSQNHYIRATENPFSVVFLSHIAFPALGDIDADGDLDLFVGQYNSNDMLFYRNTGTAQEAVYVEQTGMDNPLDVYSSNSGCNGPALVDIDADGDLDVFVGIWTNIIRHLSNAGTPSEPDFVFQTGSNNPLDQVLTEGICSYPAFVDIDADADLDVFITDANGNIEFYQNTGDKYHAVFVIDSVNNVLGNVSLSARARIAFEDVSGDGLVDAVISQDLAEPELLYFENIGSAGSAVFEQRTGAANPFDGITGTEALVPQFADVDDDGDRDLIVGTWRAVELYEAVQTSGISDVAGADKLKVFPNPASDFFSVQGEAIQMVEVINQAGKRIGQLLPTGESTAINVSNVPRGIYFVRIITEDGTATRRIILQ